MALIVPVIVTPSCFAMASPVGKYSALAGGEVINAILVACSNFTAA